MIRIIKGDCRERLRDLPDESVHCVVTSPPYFGLRDYGTDGQIGLEQTPQEYVDQLVVAVFREVRRVLRKDGTVWLNLGDCYAGSWGNYGGQNRSAGKQRAIVAGSRIPNEAWDERTKFLPPAANGFPGIKPKDLIGIPWLVAFALQADGWWLRQDIIWAKPNPMPESVTDRCTKSHEYIFLLSKRERYFYDAEAIAEDAVREPMPMQASAQAAMLKSLGPMSRGNGINHQFADPARLWAENGKRNKRSVWTVATQPFSEAHFATFPPDLIEPCIKAGTSEKGRCGKCGAPYARQIERQGGSYTERKAKGIGGPYNGKPEEYQTCGSSQSITVGWSSSCQCNADTVPCTVLDPFAGAGTTGLVADRLGRNAILIELNHEYAEMTERRIVDDAGMFAQMALGCECVEPRE